MLVALVRSDQRVIGVRFRAGLPRAAFPLALPPLRLGELTAGEEARPAGVSTWRSNTTVPHHFDVPMNERIDQAIV